MLILLNRNTVITIKSRTTQEPSRCPYGLSTLFLLCFIPGLTRTFVRFQREQKVQWQIPWCLWPALWLAVSSFSGTSSTISSWTCSNILVLKFPSIRAWSSRIIAILRISAADPWIGELVAVRSANPRTLKLRELISGISDDGEREFLHSLYLEPLVPHFPYNS